MMILMVVVMKVVFMKDGEGFGDDTDGGDEGMVMVMIKDTDGGNDG